MSKYFYYGDVKMSNKSVTLKVDPEIYDEYRKYCKKKGLIVSRQFEIMMEEQLKGEEKND